MFAALTLANASALLAGVFIPLLIFAYLRTERSQKIAVPSLLIMRKLHSQRVRRARVKLPWRFYLELLILLLLVFCAALPERRDSSSIVALVIDNSLSMQAQETSGGSRLESAKREALSYLNSLDDGSKVVLYRSSPAITEVSVKPVYPSEASEQLEKIKPSLCGESLGGDLRVLAESGRYREIMLISDLSVSFQEPKVPSSGGLSSGPAEIRQRTTLKEVRVGQPASNMFIANVRYGEMDVDGRSFNIIATLNLSALTSQDAQVKVLAASNKNAELRTIKTESVVLVPERAQDVLFNVPVLPDVTWVVRLEASADSRVVGDAIRQDNEAHLVPPGDRGMDALLVTSRETNDSLGLNSLANLRFRSVSPAQFTSMMPGEVEQLALLVFHQSAPQEAYRVPSLFIVPPDNNRFFPVKKTANLPNIASWSEQHPIVSYLRVPLLPLERSLIFETPQWARDVINVEQGPIVVAGESLGISFAATGFEILPFEAERTPSVSVLTLNLLRWLLSSRKQSGDTVLTGATFNLPNNEGWKMRTPHGQERLVNAGSDDAGVLLEESGVYFFRRPGVKDRVIAVNAFYAGESSTNQVQNLNLPQFVESEIDKEAEAQPLWPNLLKIVLVLAILDWLWRLFSRRAADGNR